MKIINMFFFHEKKRIAKGLSRILDERNFFDNFFVVMGQLLCEKNFFGAPITPKGDLTCVPLFSFHTDPVYKDVSLGNGQYLRTW